MARVSLFGTGKKGKSVTLSSQRLVNLFPEISEQPDRSILSLHNTPGTHLFVDFGDTPTRGMHATGNFLYVVHKETFWQVNRAGIKVSRGTINTNTGIVGMADNGVQVMVVDGVNGWIFNTSTLAFTQIIDPDFPAGADVVAYADSFFVVNSSIVGQFNKSAIFNGLVWDPLDFATAEYAPDALLNIFSHQGYLVLFGLNTIEGWQNVGSLNFPYQRVSGGVLEFGLRAKRSVARYDSSLIFLGTNRLGGTQVFIMDGFQVRVISRHDMDAELDKYSHEGAVAFSFYASGHSFYQLSFPIDGKVWLYDLGTENWTELTSTAGVRNRGHLGEFFIDRFMTSDFENGKIYEIDEEDLTANGVVIERELISRHVFGDLRQSVRNVWLDIEPATGTPDVPNPSVVLTVSRDGGNTFGTGQPARIGSTGKYLNRCRWTRLGRARDWVFKFRLTDPVKFVITGAWMNTLEP